MACGGVIWDIWGSERCTPVIWGMYGIWGGGGGGGVSGVPSDMGHVGEYEVFPVIWDMWGSEPVIWGVCVCVCVCGGGGGGGGGVSQ